VRLSEAWELVGLGSRRSTGNRALDRCHDIAALRAAARRRLPRAVFDYIDGGADEELTLAGNREAFHRVRFRPRALQDVSAPSLSTRLLGTELPAPIALAPTGYTRMIHPDAETGVARAAAARGLPYTLSTVATTTIEDVAATGHPNLWFQLYVLRDRGLTRALVDRAADAGFRVLEIAVDSAVSGHRTRDVRNGLTIPPQLTAKTLLGIGAHPGYWSSVLRGAPLTLANLRDTGPDGRPNARPRAGGPGTVAGINELFDPSVTWDDLASLREHWSGALVLKGPLGPSDVRRAVDLGIDGIHLSNHGGRQLDRCVSPLDLLRPAREAAGELPTILLDSGIRSGADIAAAIALGADACVVGRAYLYGAAAAGQRGVEHAIDLLTGQLRRTLQLLGATDLADLRKHGAELVVLDQHRLDQHRVDQHRVPAEGWPGHG